MSPLGWEGSPGRFFVDGGPGLYRDFYRVGYGVGGLVSVTLGLGGGWDSQRRLLRGSGTVPGFVQGW